MRIRIAIVYAVANAFERLSLRVQDEHAGWHRQSLPRKRRQLGNRVAFAEEMPADIGRQHLYLPDFRIGGQK